MSDSTTTPYTSSSTTGNNGPGQGSPQGLPKLERKPTWEYPLSKTEKEKRMELCYRNEVMMASEEKKMDETVIHTLKQMNDRLESEKIQLLAEVTRRTRTHNLNAQQQNSMNGGGGNRQGSDSNGGGSGNTSTVFAIQEEAEEGADESNHDVDYNDIERAYNFTEVNNQVLKENGMIGANGKRLVGQYYEAVPQPPIAQDSYAAGAGGSCGIREREKLSDANSNQSGGDSVSSQQQTSGSQAQSQSNVKGQQTLQQKKTNQNNIMKNTNISPGPGTNQRPPGGPGNGQQRQQNQQNPAVHGGSANTNTATNLVNVDDQTVQIRKELIYGCFIIPLSIILVIVVCYCIFIDIPSFNLNNTKWIAGYYFNTYSSSGNTITQKNSNDQLISDSDDNFGLPSSQPHSASNPGGYPGGSFPKKINQDQDSESVDNDLRILASQKRIDELERKLIQERSLNHRGSMKQTLQDIVTDSSSSESKGIMPMGTDLYNPIKSQSGSESVPAFTDPNQLKIQNALSLLGQNQCNKAADELYSILSSQSFYNYNYNATSSTTESESDSYQQQQLLYYQPNVTAKLTRDYAYSLFCHKPSRRQESLEAFDTGFSLVGWQPRWAWNMVGYIQSENGIYEDALRAYDQAIIEDRALKQKREKDGGGGRVGMRDEATNMLQVNLLRDEATNMLLNNYIGSIVLYIMEKPEERMDQFLHGGIDAANELMNQLEIIQQQSQSSTSDEENENSENTATMDFYKDTLRQFEIFVKEGTFFAPRMAVFYDWGADS